MYVAFADLTTAITTSASGLHGFGVHPARQRCNTTPKQSITTQPRQCLSDQGCHCLVAFPKTIRGPTLGQAKDVTALQDIPKTDIANA
jgi:hypothetical protein